MQGDCHEKETKKGQILVHNFLFSPKFTVKKAKSRCHKFETSLFAPGQSKLPQIGLRLQSQALFKIKATGAAVSGLFMAHLGLNVKMLWPLWPPKSSKPHKC